MKWQIVQTDSGFHLVLRAENSEPIVWSETYEEKRTAVEALHLVGKSFTVDIQGDDYQQFVLQAPIDFLDTRSES